jgi:hypothetical protein
MITARDSDAIAARRAVMYSIARIEQHLVRYASGHDPLGHLLAIERLARAARAECRAIDVRAYDERDA